MITKNSYTRITLALDIIGKIYNGPMKGYHELGIIKHQITLCDSIEVKESRSTKIECSDTAVPHDSSNICWKAVDLIKKRYGIDKNVTISIDKNIPVMGGLAGGSANAATMIDILNELWALNFSKEEKKQLGRKLGMDVPFFFDGGTAFDTETTGVLQKIDTDLFATFVLVIPNFGVSTRDAYGGIDYSKVAKKTLQTSEMKSCISLNDMSKVVSLMHNDFELSVFPRYPQLQQIRDKMLEAGCLNAIMSGSGSTLIGIVRNRKEAMRVCNSLEYKSIITETLKR
ncbi:4-(cytidine 5'-diphospho)-2-C-methyl-D-erythritol kinase [Chitinispirillales bacterium ANBcel5]|uniref:4-(cytidine 5'-diphospho)-2-C-methyl-D-erythritol kinase n=1 Tax=Cellulosispirillum alkaliphilum TaxID=3039283 RepID=UPI002A58A710|nr:4-(cytidine 5'-diphospho)-2-C-methyl-D-erythritol kinase [Chitinispirillales bacterium ANBcel5]